MISTEQAERLTSNFRKMIGSERFGAKRSSGEWNLLFEQKFAAWHGVKYAVAFHSGSSALHAALDAAGVQPGDLVVTDPLMRFAASAAYMCRARVAFADVCDQDYLISARSVEDRLRFGPKAIVGTALFGSAVDVRALKAVLGGSQAVLIEDCAQALGVRRDGRLAGTGVDIAVFSFQSSKHLNLGEGGMIITDSDVFAERARSLRDHGWRKSQPNCEAPLASNYRMTEITAMMGVVLLEDVDRLLDMYRQKVALLARLTTAVPGLYSPHLPPQSTCLRWAGHLSSAQSVQMLAEQRDLVQHGFEFGFCHPGPIYLRPAIARMLTSPEEDAQYFSLGLCPMAEGLTERMITLPITPQRSTESLGSAFEALTAHCQRVVLDKLLNGATSQD